jgi:hypothetical protein
MKKNSGNFSIYDGENKQRIIINNADGDNKNYYDADAHTFRVRAGGSGGNVTIENGLKITGSTSDNNNLNGRQTGAEINNIKIGNNLISNVGSGDNLLIGSGNGTVQIWSSNLAVDGNIYGANTWVNYVNVSSGANGTTKKLYDGSPLRSDVKYLIEAHVSYVHTGSGFDGIMVTVDNTVGGEDGSGPNKANWSIPYVSGYANNVADLGGSAQATGGGANTWSHRSVAVGVITGPNLSLTLKSGTDDGPKVYALIKATPCYGA